MPADPKQETTDLAGLLTRLEGHVGEWDSRNDEAIARFMGWDQDAAGEWHQVGNFFGDGLRRTAYAVELPPFTRSLDAALSLVPQGWNWEVYSDGAALVWRDPSERNGIRQTATARRCATPALAICVAALRAREAANG